MSAAKGQAKKERTDRLLEQREQAPRLIDIWSGFRKGKICMRGALLSFGCGKNWEVAQSPPSGWEFGREREGKRAQHFEIDSRAQAEKQ